MTRISIFLVLLLTTLAACNTTKPDKHLQSANVINEENLTSLPEKLERRLNAKHKQWKRENVRMDKKNNQVDLHLTFDGKPALVAVAILHTLPAAQQAFAKFMLLVPNKEKVEGIGDEAYLAREKIMAPCSIHVRAANAIFTVHASTEAVCRELAGDTLDSLLQD